MSEMPSVTPRYAPIWDAIDRKIAKAIQADRAFEDRHGYMSFSEIFCCDFVYIFGPFGDREHDTSDWPVPSFLVKVGWTSNPKENLASLRRGRPSYFYWSCRLVYERGRMIEAILHSLWRPFLVEGEFYQLPEPEIEWFQEIPQSIFVKHRIGYIDTILRCREQWMEANGFSSAKSAVKNP